jgi:hypothetical protein
MGKKTERLRHLVNELASRYGDDDVDVMRLKANLDELHEIQVSRIESRALERMKFDFRSNAQRLYQTSKSGDRH